MTYSLLDTITGKTAEVATPYQVGSVLTEWLDPDDRQSDLIAGLVLALESGRSVNRYAVALLVTITSDSLTHVETRPLTSGASRKTRITSYFDEPHVTAAANLAASLTLGRTDGRTITRADVLRAAVEIGMRDRPTLTVALEQEVGA